MPAQHVELGRELLDRTARVVPVLREARHRAKRAALALPADADRWVRALHRLRVAVRVHELHVATVERGGLVGEQADDRLAALVEGVEALGEGRVQVDAVGLRLDLVPPRADAELQAGRRTRCRASAAILASTAGCRYGMPVTSTPTRSRRVAWARAVVRDPPLQARAADVVGEDRVEVVEGPGRLEELDLVGGLPDREHVGPGGVLRCGLESEAHAGSLAAPRTAGPERDAKGTRHPLGSMRRCRRNPSGALRAGDEGRSACGSTAATWPRSAWSSPSSRPSRWRRSGC